MLESHSISVVQVNLNMLDTRAVECGLLELAARRGVGVIARTPLSFGFLSGAVTATTEFPVGDHRRRWPRAQIERWVEGAQAMHDAAEAPDGQTRSQVALRFGLSFPEVSAVIPGILAPEEAEQNAVASDLGPLGDSARDRILQINRDVSFFIGA
jgi:aryl-alcohol dehydrogenase-like predicted oxidoreductase